MEKNCLITKLKGSVTGNAPIFGQLEMIIAGGLNVNLYQSLSAQSNEESVVSGNNGIVFKNFSLSEEYSNPFTLTSNMQGFNVICTTDAKMVVTNKYKLRAPYGKYGFAGVKEFIGGIDSFIYSIPDDATEVALSPCFSKIELSDIVPKIITINSSITVFNFGKSPLIEGNINVFRNISNLRNLDFTYCTLVNGTIADLKSITTIENIACAGTQVSGTIEEFVAGQRAAGRTTGRITGNSGDWGNVTFDGATTHAKGAVSWTATTITMDGVTINA